jgi:hypothetical protein
MKPTYTKLDANGNDLPADSAEKHLAVRVDHPLLAQPFVIAAYRSGDAVPFKDVVKSAEAHDAYGWKWRAPTVEELYLVADLTNPECRLDPNFFPDAKGYEYTWSSTVDAEDPSVYAWVVDLGSGDSGRYDRSGRSGVRAVRAGQSFGN